jgi:hypothetical protein
VSEGPTDTEEAVVAGLLGRSPRGRWQVVVRGPDKGPVVIWNAPQLDDGTPMPTTYWLVGRRERDAVSRLEAAGGVREAEQAVDPAELAAAHSCYAAARAAAVASPPEGGHLPTGGVGGTRRGVKCLHAHLAFFLAGGEDPVGRWTAQKLGIARQDYEVTT